MSRGKSWHKDEIGLDILQKWKEVSVAEEKGCLAGRRLCVLCSPGEKNEVYSQRFTRPWMSLLTEVHKIIQNHGFATVCQNYMQGYLQSLFMYLQ